MDNNSRNAFIFQFFVDDGVDAAPLKFAVEWLSSNASHEETVRKAKKKVRNENYAEVTVPTFTDKQFQEHFRTGRDVMEKLLNVLAHHFEGKEVPSENVPLPKKLLFTIWLLSKQESFLAVGDRFNIPTSSGHGIFKSITYALADLMPEYIKWPTAEQQNTTSQIFEERSRGIPGVIGAIDGCHIPIKPPAGNANDFYNRKQFHSIILQGVCDHTGRFIDVFIGVPGRVHDARVFRSSELWALMADTTSPLLADDAHLIGDCAYPLMVNLMTPFRDNGHLSAAQVRYNTRLSAIRSIVERAFGLLKVKFRRLKYLDIAEVNTGNTIIAAVCMLHNFIKMNGHEDDVCDEIEIIEAADEDDILNSRPAGEAISKRNRIMNSL